MEKQHIEILAKCKPNVTVPLVGGDPAALECYVNGWLREICRQDDDLHHTITYTITALGVKALDEALHDADAS